LRQFIIRWLIRVGAALVLLTLLAFVADAIALRLKFPNNRQQFSTVQIRPYYAVKMKDGKTEFMFDQPQDETCVNALFPQLGFRPCWLVAKSKTKRIDVK
jgi:hypothetical protein